MYRVRKQGRISEDEMVLSRANKSVRLFAHVVDRLSAGMQPDKEMLDSVGYLVRTTAVYGSGKFGAADRARWGRPARIHRILPARTCWRCG